MIVKKGFKGNKRMVNWCIKLHKMAASFAKKYYMAAERMAAEPLKYVGGCCTLKYMSLGVETWEEGAGEVWALTVRG